MYLQQEPQKIQGKLTLQVTDHQEYADDTILAFKTLKLQEMNLQLQHYKIVTESRKLLIQWKKVELLTMHKPYLKKNPFPEPYNEIKIKKKEKC